MIELPFKAGDILEQTRTGVKWVITYIGKPKRLEIKPHWLNTIKFDVVIREKLTDLIIEGECTISEAKSAVDYATATYIPNWKFLFSIHFGRFETRYYLNSKDYTPKLSSWKFTHGAKITQV